MNDNHIETSIDEDNTTIVNDELQSAMLRGLEKIGLVGEGYAKLLCPVDTGRLRNSITHEVSIYELATYIGTNVEYALPVELGTSKTKAQPFLKPAVTDHIAEYRIILENELH